MYTTRTSLTSPLVFFLAAYLASTDAVASTSSFSTGGNLSMEITSPLLNLDTCSLSDQSLTITIESQPTQHTALASGQHLYVWWTLTAESSCETPSSEPDYILYDGLTLETDHPLLSTTQTFDLLEDSEISITPESLYERHGSDVCTTNPTGHSEYKLCVAIDTNSDKTIQEDSEPYGWVLFTVDTLAPPQPNAPTLEARENTLSLQTSMPSSGESDDIGAWTVRYQQASITDESESLQESCANWVSPGEEKITSTIQEATLDIEVENGVPYDLCVIAEDNLENQSEPSPMVRGEATEECDFIECYPGELQSGFCNATGPQPYLLLALLAFFFRARKHRLQISPTYLKTILYLVSGNLVLSASSPDLHARSYGKEEPTTYRVEIKAGPFKPHISDDLQARELYDQVFNAGSEASFFNRRPVLLALEFDWYPQIFNQIPYSLVGGGLQFGYWSKRGYTRVCNSTEEPISTIPCTADTVATSQVGSTPTKLAIVPFQVDLIYRLTALRDLWAIPLEIYVKGGLDYFFWWNTVSGKISERSDGTKGSGGTLGYHGSLGIALQLDWIDASRASRRQSDNTNASYLFMEATMRSINEFGNQERLDMSDNQIFIGIALDFAG